MMSGVLPLQLFSNCFLLLYSQTRVTHKKDIHFHCAGLLISSLSARMSPSSLSAVSHCVDGFSGQHKQLKNTYSTSFFFSLAVCCCSVWRKPHCYVSCFCRYCNLNKCTWLMMLVIVPLFVCSGRRQWSPCRGRNVPDGEGCYIIYGNYFEILVNEQKNGSCISKCMLSVSDYDFLLVEIEMAV